MGYAIKVTGIRSARLHVKRIKRNAGDLTNAWPSVGAYMSRVANRQFVTEGAFLGRPWQPLKPEYRLWKIRHGYSRKILVQGGQLRREFTGRPMAVEEYTRDSATFGSGSDKAVWHHNGTQRNGKQVNPARPILYVTPTVRKDVRDILAKKIMGRAR